MGPIGPVGWTMTAAERATLEQLRQENQALRVEVAALEQTIRDLTDRNRHLQESLDEQERAAARQAAPFRRRQSRKVPDGSKKRPGRPLGHPGVHRAVPDGHGAGAGSPTGTRARTASFAHARPGRHAYARRRARRQPLADRGRGGRARHR